MEWKLDFAPEYKFSNAGECTKKGKVIRRVMIGYSVGYCINGRFKTLKTLRKHLVKSTDIYCPF
jgi:hypothetical protein